MPPPLEGTHVDFDGHFRHAPPLLHEEIFLEPKERMSINLPPYDRCQPLQLLTAVYVLKLEGGRVYIGQTRNLSNRLSEHWRQGSTMTRTYKPSGVVELVFPANRDTEKQKTIEYARRLGWNQPDGTPNVRGSDWARLDAKSPLDSRRSVLDSGNGHRNGSESRQATDTAYRRTASGRCGAAAECESYGFVTELTAP